MRITEEERVEEGLDSGRIEMPKHISEEVETARAVIERLRQRKPLTTPTPVCRWECANGWLRVEKAGILYAEPCPECKPNWVHPDQRRKEAAKPTEEEAEKKDRGKWWD